MGNYTYGNNGPWGGYGNEWIFRPRSRKEKCVSRHFVTRCRIATVIDRLFAGDGSIATMGNTIDGSNGLWVTEANGYLDRRGAVPPWLKG